LITFPVTVDPQATPLPVVEFGQVFPLPTLHLPDLQLFPRDSPVDDPSSYSSHLFPTIAERTLFVDSPTRFVCSYVYLPVVCFTVPDVTF